MRKMFFAVVFWFIAGGTSPVWAACGAANCNLETGTQEGSFPKGRFTLDLSYRWIPMDHGQRGSDGTPEVVVPKIDFENGVIVPAGEEESHIEKRTNNELVNLDLGSGVTDWMKARLGLPLINDRTHEHDHWPGGEFTREDSTSGFGDVRLIGEFSVFRGERNSVSLGIGAKFPTGEYKLRDHDGELNEPTIQPGTGSWDGLVSARYGGQVVPGRLQGFLSGSYQLTTENPEEYRFGNTLLANTGLNLHLDDRWTPSLQVNLRHAERDEFNGMDVPSTGGTWVYLTPGMTFRITEAASIYTHVQIPVYQYVNDVNLVPRYGLMIGFSYSIGTQKPAEGESAFPSSILKDQE